MADGERSSNQTKRISRNAVAELRSEGRERRRALLVYHRDGAQIVPLPSTVPLVVGRSQPSDVVIPDASLSRQHARFSIVGDDVIVEDLGSTNGTRIGDATIERARLDPGVDAWLGGIAVSVCELAPDGTPSRGVSGYERFRAALEEELVRARHFRREVSLLLVRSPKKTGGSARLWFPRIEPLLRPVDRLGLYSDDAVEVLLPEMGLADAEAVARSIASCGERDEPLACGVAVFPRHATSVEALLAAARAAAERTSDADPVRVADELGRTWVSPDSAAALASGPTTNAPAMRQLLATALRVAKGAVAVLLEGETGSGKEVLARFVHDESLRKAAPLVCVNCAAIPSQLVESTLFGHEKGSFTGATQQHKGVFEVADGGTVFLDEIGELPMAAQAALLRVLEAKRFSRVGSSSEIAVDVRILAATHRDLEALVREGRFRQDLLYRLNTVVLRVPPLRARREDIAPLATLFLAKAAEAAGSFVRSIDPEALDLLAGYDWPGNVRELKNAMERAVAIAQGDVVTADDLPERVRGVALPVATGTSAPPPPAVAWELVRQLEGDFRTRMERLEAEILTGALREAGWNQTETARRLQMPLRTLVYKLRTLGVRKPRSTDPPPRTS